MDINDYFYSVVTEYGRTSGFEQAEFEEIPVALRIDEMLFCYRKMFKINDEQVQPLDAHLLDEYLDKHGKFPDVYVFMYCLKNDSETLHLLVNHPDSQKYISHKLVRLEVLTHPCDIIAMTIDYMICELIHMFDDKKSISFCFENEDDDGKRNIS